MRPTISSIFRSRSAVRTSYSDESLSDTEAGNKAPFVVRHVRLKQFVFLHPPLLLSVVGICRTVYEVLSIFLLSIGDDFCFVLFYSKTGLCSI